MCVTSVLRLPTQNKRLQSVSAWINHSAPTLNNVFASSPPNETKDLSEHQKVGGHTTADEEPPEAPICTLSRAAAASPELQSPAPQFIHPSFLFFFPFFFWEEASRWFGGVGEKKNPFTIF